MQSDLQSPMIRAFCLVMLLVSVWVCKQVQTSTYACGGQGLTSAMFPVLPTIHPYFWDSLSLNLKLIDSATLSGQWGSWLCPILLPSAGVMGAHYHSWLFTWVLGAQIQIPVLALQELYRLSLSPGLISAFLCTVYSYLGLHNHKSIFFHNCSSLTVSV